MRNFFYFLLRHSTLIYFIILEGICAALIVNYNDYQKSAFMSSSNAICGTIYDIGDGISQYFHLGSANEQLAQENAQLRNRIAKLERQIAMIEDSAREKSIGDTLQKYYYYPAHVINSSTNKSRNYLTIDRGEETGIRQNMFVQNGSGVVGLVTAVSSHYATVLPIINTSMRLSIKLEDTNYRGQLIWNGMSPHYAVAIDIPEHAKINVGDRIVTSGSSDYFPEGIHVGEVDEVNMDKNGGFYRLTIKLAVDFNSLYDVEIIENREQREQRELEANMTNEKQ